MDVNGIPGDTKPRWPKSTLFPVISAIFWPIFQYGSGTWMALSSHPSPPIDIFCLVVTGTMEWIMTFQINWEIQKIPTDFHSIIFQRAGEKPPTSNG